MLKDLLDAVMAAGMYRLVLLPFLVAPYILYWVLTSERRRKARDNLIDEKQPSN
jgi:hypothetical protein